LIAENSLSEDCGTFDTKMLLAKALLGGAPSFVFPFRQAVERHPAMAVLFGETTSL
jgi:hypothetical protein